MALITNLLSSLLSRIIGEEISAWVPRISAALIRHAVARLPECQRERFCEEWQSHIDEVPGIFGKLFAAADFSRGAISMRMSLQHREVAESWLRAAEQFKESHSKTLALLARFEQAVTRKGFVDIEAARPHLDRLNGLREGLEKINSEVNKLPEVMAAYAQEPCTLRERLMHRRQLTQLREGFIIISRFGRGLDIIADAVAKGLADKRLS